jgi:hypothetical protein
MGDGGALGRHSRARAWRDLKAWFERNKPFAVFALLLAAITIPCVAVIRGATMTDFKNALGDFIAASVLAPISLTAIAFLWFWFRAPSREYALRVQELREHRSRQGMPTDDLDAPMIHSGWWGWYIAFSNRHFGPILLGAFFLLFASLVYISHAFVVADSAFDKSYKAVLVMVGVAHKYEGVVDTLEHQRDVLIAANLAFCAHQNKTSEFSGSVEMCHTVQKLATDIQKWKTLEKRRDHPRQ